MREFWGIRDTVRERRLAIVMLVCVGIGMALIYIVLAVSSSERSAPFGTGGADYGPAHYPSDRAPWKR